MAVTEARAARPGNALGLRILSALVLAPTAIAAVWFGRPYLPVLVALASAVMEWEWVRLCTGGRLAGPDKPAGDRRLWLVLGTLWIALPCVLLLWLAQADELGRATVLWIFAVVWATDIGAYAAGRRIGGPRLAPRWSPGKTWAGLMGGIACAALAGWATAAILGLASALPLVLVSAGLAVVEQFGDLAESVAKRRFGVKDSSGLIPGHGGLLDRLDGLLAVVPAVALLTVATGNSVLQWRW